MKTSLFFASAAALLAFAMPAAANAGVVFGASSYNSDVTLVADPSSTGVSVAASGGNYYAATGGYASSPIAEFSANGTLIATASPTPGIDFRSIFTDASGAVYAKGYNNPNTIYRQTSFGTFTPAVTLDGSVSNQAQVVLNGSGTMYVSNVFGNVSEWSLTGQLLRNFRIDAIGGAQTISAYGAYLLNYQNDTLSAYDEVTGALVDSTVLNGAGNSAYYGTALANGHFFVPTSSYGSTFAGYDVGLNAGAVPEPASWAMMILGMGAVGFAMRRKMRLSNAKFDAHIKSVTYGTAA